MLKRQRYKREKSDFRALQLYIAVVILRHTEATASGINTNNIQKSRQSKPTKPILENGNLEPVLVLYMNDTANVSSLQI